MASESETTAVSTITSATVDDGGAHESKRELGSGAATSPGVGQEEDEEMLGPGPAPAKQRKKRPLQFEQAFLDALPSAAMCVFSSLAFWSQDFRGALWLTVVFGFAGTRRAICIGTSSPTSPSLRPTSSSLGAQMVISLTLSYHILVPAL